MSRKLRVGIAGLGRIFDLNSLGYVNHPEAEVAALCDSRPDLLKQRQPVFPQARTTTRYEEMLGWDLDLVDILTPHPLHEGMAVAALAAGAHVSVQKPMAMTLGECDRMIAQSRRSDRCLKPVRRIQSRCRSRTARLQRAQSCAPAAPPGKIGRRPR